MQPNFFFAGSGGDLELALEPDDIDEDLELVGDMLASIPGNVIFFVGCLITPLFAKL